MYQWRYNAKYQPSRQFVKKTVEVLQIQFLDRVVDVLVDEHIDDSCDCISDFQTEVLSKEKCARSLMIASLNACRTGDCVDKVNGYMCDCDEDHELMLQVKAQRVWQGM